MTQEAQDPLQSSIPPLGRVKGASTYNTSAADRDEAIPPPPGRKDVAVATTQQSVARRCAEGPARLFSASHIAPLSIHTRRDGPGNLKDPAETTQLAGCSLNSNPESSTSQTVTLTSLPCWWATDLCDFPGEAVL